MAAADAKIEKVTVAAILDRIRATLRAACGSDGLVVVCGFRSKH